MSRCVCMCVCVCVCVCLFFLSSFGHLVFDSEDCLHHRRVHDHTPNWRGTGFNSNTETHRKRSDGRRVHEHELAKPGAKACPHSPNVLGRVNPAARRSGAVRSGPLSRSRRYGTSSGGRNLWIVEPGRNGTCRKQGPTMVVCGRPTTWTSPQTQLT